MEIKIEYHIKQIREEKNITLRELERLSGVSNSHISEIERGNKVPSLYVLCALATALEKDVCELFTYCSL